MSSCLGGHFGSLWPSSCVYISLTFIIITIIWFSGPQRGETLASLEPKTRADAPLFWALCFILVLFCLHWFAWWVRVLNLEPPDSVYWLNNKEAERQCCLSEQTTIKFSSFKSANLFLAPSVHICMLSFYKNQTEKECEPRFVASREARDVSLLIESIRERLTLILYARVKLILSVCLSDWGCQAWEKRRPCFVCLANWSLFVCLFDFASKTTSEVQHCTWRVSIRRPNSGDLFYVGSG